MHDFAELTKSRADIFSDRKIYTDPAILGQERDKIFRKAWVFLCHASQLPRPGDFKCLSIVGEPLIVARAADGEIHAFFNSCRHRGSIVELEAEGNRTKFECPYHGFQYDCTGALIHVPKEEAYGSWFRKEDFGLVALPKIAVRNGMIFASLNPDAGSFDDYLGSAQAAVDYSSTRDGEPLKVFGTLKYDMCANWKLLMDNTMDGYHVPYVHGDMMTYQPEQSMREEEEVAEEAEPDYAHIWGYHGGISWTAMSAPTARDRGGYVAVFPNVTLHYNSGLDIYGIRQIDALAVDRMQVTMYFLMQESASSELIADRAGRFAMLWGPGGLFGADDARQVEWVHRGLRARVESPVIAARGIGRAFNGAGQGIFEDEHPMRGFRAGWAHYMGWPAGDGDVSV